MQDVDENRLQRFEALTVSECLRKELEVIGNTAHPCCLC